MAWSVDMVSEVKTWLTSLDEDTFKQVAATIDILREEGVPWWIPSKARDSPI